jgi:hypothetical protein
MRSKEWKQLELFEISPEEMKLLTLIRDMKIMMDDFSREKLELLELKSDLLVHKDDLINAIRNITFPDDAENFSHEWPTNHTLERIQETENQLDSEEGPNGDDTIH